MLVSQRFSDCPDGLQAPIRPEMAQRLWALRKEAGGGDDDLVFPSASGSPLNDSNLYRVFRPAAARAGVPWATFHTLQHTCATALFRHGMNAKQVQGWLGHHAASFTLDTYVHLLPDDVAEAPAAFDELHAGDLALDDGPHHLDERVFAV